MTLPSGTRIGAYEIVSALGEGGMGAVYRARDTELHRDVAIKVLLRVVAGDPDRLARFGREAQVLASLNHPNIAAIYGLVDTERGKALVLELVEGPTLADLIERAPIPLDEALAIARQIADALDTAHEQGIVHRDLKPANIKVRSDGTVKVLDFGLAKAMEPAGSSVAGVSATMSPTMSMHATMAGLILGTAAYMSPEQASGKAVDKRADIWAFGVVLWEMLTGRQMFEGETISHVLASVLKEDPDLTSVPHRVRPLLTRCLQKDPRKRLRDIGDAMSLLEETTVPARVEAPAHRWSVVAAWSAAGIMAVALVIASWSMARSIPDSDAAAPAVRLQIERSSTNLTDIPAAAFSLSPDGRFLAHYGTGTTGRTLLSVRTLATGETREIPDSEVLNPRTPPFWSADSTQVAYVTTEAAQVLDVSTGTTRELCVCRFQGGSWNRDGVILVGGWSPGEPIRRLSLQDRTPVAVTSSDPGKAGRDTWPVFLPDGRRFLFTREMQGSRAMTYVGSLDGGEPVRAADGSRRLFAASPNGLEQWVLGVEAAGLVAHAFDAEAMQAGGEPLVVVPGAAAASISGNGVMATSAGGSQPVMRPTWFDRTGAVVGTVGDPGPVYSSSLSPDGRTVAVAVQEDTSRGSQIWLRDSSGANRRLTFNRDASPAWSPDGLRILVSSYRDGVVNLYERTVDGSGPETRLFVADRDAYANDWSRDGRWVIYSIPKDVSSALDLDLWTFPLDGSGERKPVPYLTGRAREAQAEFSPDGRFVAYTSTESGDPEVYVQPFPNASEGKWLVSAGGGVEPHWSRDGKELFYFAGRTLMAVPVGVQPTFSHDSPTRLFDAPVQPWYVNDSDRTQVSADGKRFLILVQEGKTAAPPIDVVVNWLSLLTK